MCNYKKEETPMKKRSLGISLLLTGFALTLGAFLVPSNNPSESSASSYSVNSVPTTIDLNDTTAANIRSYYSSLSSLGTAERQGTNLLKNLKPILKNNQKYYSYGSSATTAVWQCYEIVDRDWDKSPASAISGYNSSTNKITGYVYGTSNSNVGSNPYIHALYVNRNVTNQTRAWGNHNQDQWGINQEHVWAKSCGFNDNSPAAGARGDLMHLWAGNGKVNGTYHSNYYYGYVDKTQSYDNASSYASTLSGNLKGKSKSLGGSYTVFEPQDSDKGDIARAIFYMAARYNYLSGSDSDGIDAGNPNLEIVNVLNWAPGSSYQSTTSKKGQMGILQDLLEWNRIDPPDEWEIHRNNLLYNNFTKNRNPFIDFPEWAEFIWGKCTDGNYSSTSTGYATPASDNINTFSSGSTVSVTGVTLNKASTSIYKGSTETLYATVAPNNASNKNVTWSSSNTSVATVSASGVVTAKANGSATITVTTVDGSYTATCLVTVTSTKTVNSISVDGQTTNFNVGDTYLFDGTVTAYYNDSTSSTVASGYTVSSPDMSTSGEKTVTVTYSGKTANFTITVNDATADGDAELYTGAIAEGDYVIYYNGKAVENTIASNRLTYVEVTPSDDVISSPDPSIIWHIAPNGNYWTVYNAAVSKYAGSTSAKNQAALLSSVSDNAKWTITGSSTYEFENLARSTGSDSANKWLRLNGTYGFACYSTSTGGELSLYKVVASSPVEPTSIVATVSKSFYVGETITKSDITVKDNFNNVITDFEFDDYTFVYEDTPGGGDNSYEIDFDIEYESLETTLCVEVSRKAHVEATGGVSDTLDLAYTGQSGSSYGSWSAKAAPNSNAYYKGNNAGSNSTIQLRSSASSGNYSGIVSTVSGGNISSVTVNWYSGTVDGRVLNVYGKATAYSSPNDLFNSTAQGTLLGTITKGSTTSLTISGEYAYVGVCSSSGALYLTDITFTYGSNDSAKNLANYIMYEDTNNQCSTKFDVAKGYFEGLSKAERSTFMTSSDYVILTARTRLEAWARNQGKSISNVNGDYIVSAQQNPITVMSINNNSNVIIIVVASVVMIAAVGGYFYIRRLKQK